MDQGTSFDAKFREAVSAIDAGDIAKLQRLITANPALVRDRLESPGAWLRDVVGGALAGFFQRPNVRGQFAFAHRIFGDEPQQVA